MNFHRNTSLMPICALLVCLASPSALPELVLARAYRAPANVPPWGVNYSLVTNGTGHFLTVRGSAPTNESAIASVSAVRLTQAGEVDWALWTLEGRVGYTSVKAHPSEPLVFARIEGLPEEEFWTVFGVFHARDGARVFECGIRVTVDHSDGLYLVEPVPRVEYLSDGRCAVLLDGSSVIRVAVLGADGQIEWQRSFASLVTPSFSIAGRGSHSTLLEDPGHGFWLFVAGSEKISTQPNPPTANSAVTLNVLRLSHAGELVWSRKITGLQLASIAAGPGPVAIGSDEGLVFTFSDLVLTNTFNPMPNDHHTYVVSVARDGKLRWARRIRGAGTLTPVLGRDPSILYLAGNKIRRVTPASTDGILLKWDAATGESLAQTSVNLNTIDDLTVAGISEHQIYLRATASLLAKPLTAYVGAFDLDLRNATWKEMSSTQVERAALLYDPAAGSLLFSSNPVEDSRIDVIPLDASLEPLSGIGQDGSGGCEFFTNATVTLLDPNLTIEKVELADSSLYVSVYDTSIELPATTRIQFQAILPTTAPLCEPDPGIAVQLACALAAESWDFILGFASHAETTYEILFTPALDQPFQPIANVIGDGRWIERRFQTSGDRNSFYTVRVRPK